MVLSVVSVPTFSAKAEDGENPPSTMTLNEALNVEGGNIEFTTSGDYISETGSNYKWIIESDYARSPVETKAGKRAIINAKVTVNKQSVVSFDFISTFASNQYTMGGLLFSIDNHEQESGNGYGYTGCYEWAHKEYVLEAGEHDLKWVFYAGYGEGNNSNYAKLDNVRISEPVHPESIITDDAVQVGVNERLRLSWTVLPENSFNKNVEFTSSDEETAYVLPDGTVIGLAEGETIITIMAEDGEAHAACRVSVIDNGTGCAEIFALCDLGVYRARSSMPEKWDFLSEITGAEEELSSTIKTVAYVDGKLYGYASFGGVKSRYFVIDEYNKKLEYCGKFNKLLPRSLAYDYTENTLYAIAYSNDSHSGYALYKVELDCGELMKIVDLSTSIQSIYEISVSSGGQIYSIIEDTVCELDKQTGETTPVLSVSSSDCIKRIITCDFNYEDNCIYGVFESRTATQGHISFPLYRINVEENKVELCGYANSSGLEIYTHNGISVPDRDKLKFEVSFIDSIDGSTISTEEYAVGTTLNEADFPEPPIHDGYEFDCWEYEDTYDGKYLLNNTNVTACYTEEDALATIIVDNHYAETNPYENWREWGCQMLLDPSASAYGTLIPAERTWGSTKVASPEIFYDSFQYRLPEGASHEITPFSTMYHKKQLINIPAGTYDWCFLAPIAGSEGTEYYFMSDDGSIAACYDDYEFKGGYTYEFKVSHKLDGTSDRNTYVDLTVTRGNSEAIYSERIEIKLQDIVVYGKRQAKIEIEVFPEDAFDKQVILYSEDPSIAYADNSSISPTIYGIAEGNTIFTVQTVDGHAETSIGVTVPQVMPTTRLNAYVYKDVFDSAPIDDQRWYSINTDNISEAWINALTDREEQYFTDHEYIINASAYVGGKVYGYGKTRAGAGFFAMDPNTMMPIYTGVNPGRQVKAVAYDHATDTMYAIARNDVIGEFNSLYRVNLPIGTLEEIASIQTSDEEGNAISIDTLSISQNGAAYGLSRGTTNRKPSLYRIDLANGQCTLIGETTMDYLPSMYVVTVYDYKNELIITYDPYNGFGSIFPGTGEYVQNKKLWSTYVSSLYITDDIEVSIPQTSNFEISFVDGETGEIIERKTVAGGTVPNKEDFPNAPEHEGLIFSGWEFDWKPISCDTEITALYAEDCFNTAVIKLTDNTNGVYYYGSQSHNGWHMLLDSDADTYGLEDGNVFTPLHNILRNLTPQTYERFEYSIPRSAAVPENATQQEFNSVEAVLNCTKSVRIPAGTYDWCILALSKTDYARYIACSSGNIGGKGNDFTFVAGYTYEFRIYQLGAGHAVDLIVTKTVEGENPDAGVCVLLGEIAGSPGEEIETEVVIEGDYEANSFDMALEYDANDIEVLEITPGQVIQEIVENGGEFDLEQFGPGSGPGEGGSGNPDSSTGTIDAKAESGGMAFSGNGQIMKMKVKIPEDAEAGEKNMDMTVNDLSKNNSDGTTEQVPHYDVTGNSATGSIGGGGSGGSGGGSGSIGGGGGGGVVTDPTTPIPTGEPTPTGEPVPTPTPNPNASFFVTFVDWDGRTIAIKTAKYGEAATPPPDPERENFIFVGWEGDFSCVTANTAVLAKYGPIPNSGDASGDGAVNAVDALVAMRYVLGVSTESLTPEQIAAADFNGDGAVNAVDTLLIMRFSLGLIEAVVKEPVQDA